MGCAWRDTVAVVVLAAAITVPISGQVTGMVVNATTNSPVSGVTLTLSSFRDGMTPVEETNSGPDGRFAFEKQLPAVSPDQPLAGAIRAEFEGIGYTKILESGALGEETQVTVYSVSESDLPAPAMRILIFEPSDSVLRVRDSYQFLNDSSAPVTYSSEDGTLRFHLPDGAQGQVDVMGTGPAGMPLRSTAMPAGGTGVYKVDFPLKPGTSRIDLTYTTPYEGVTELLVRAAYEGLLTRVVTPEGVEVAGEGLVSLGKEPRTNLLMYALPDAIENSLAISGTGRLSAPAASSQSPITVALPPISKELPWIIGLAIAILAIGFFHLWGLKLPEEHAKRNARGG